MALIPLPIIGEYTLGTQLAILAVLITASYFHRLSRLLLSSLAALYAAYKILFPLGCWLFRWSFWVVKGIAMFGFYVHFFQLGFGYIVTVMSYLSSDGHEWLVRELEKYERNRS